MALQHAQRAVRSRAPAQAALAYGEVIARVRGLARDPSPAREAWQQSSKCRGLRAAREGRVSEAIRLLELARREAPWRDAEIEANLDELRAIRRLEKHLEVRPNDAAALVEIGKAYFAQERGDAALAVFRRAVAVSPENAEAHCLLALELHYRGVRGEAEHHYREALRIEPRQVRAVLHYAAFLRGEPPLALCSPEGPTAADLAAAHKAVQAALSSPAGARPLADRS